ncbi:MAG TPA: hypothetical protein VK826_07245 [Bacteroidia bacterium]|nr:hypothetical protein [Bacteroidia bacterium]
MKKTTVIEALSEFPKEFNLDDLMERLVVIEKIDAGLKDVKEGKTVDHADVKKMIRKWRK